MNDQKPIAWIERLFEPDNELFTENLTFSQMSEKDRETISYSYRFESIPIYENPVKINKLNPWLDKEDNCFYLSDKNSQGNKNFIPLYEDYPPTIIPAQILQALQIGLKNPQIADGIGSVTEDHVNFEI